MKKLPKRKRLRMESFDYSSNFAYFLTVCTKDRKPLFRKEQKLSEIGELVKKAIEQIPLIYENVEVNKYCIMADHIHLIIIILSDGTETTPSISTVIGQMKRTVSKESGLSIWQKSFVDRVLRNSASYQAAWKYIESNPSVWEEKHETF